MGQAKLQKIGNSLGFKIAKSDLASAGFDESSEYELIVKKDVILLVKRRPEASKWVFSDSDLTKEDKTWLDSNLEN